jgi:hypothetical protein
MPKLKENVVTTLCMLEMEMPLAFFDVMTHLVLHVVEELDVCHLVSTRWMYCIERMNKVMKGHVRCMQQPEGCMAEGYAMEVSMGFIIKYMQGFRPMIRRVWDVEEEEGVSGEVFKGADSQVVLDPED